MNCNDDDMTETSIKRRPFEEPTEMSYNILRAKLMAVLQKLYVDNCSRLSSYDFIQQIDGEMMQLVESFPWFFRIRSDEEGIPTLAMGVSEYSWAQHLLHSCICVQRIRMYRPFLHPPVGAASRICRESAEDVLSVYALLRSSCGEPLRRSPKFALQSYQIYSAAVALAAFLLVERTFPSQRIRKDIEMVIADLVRGEISDAVTVDGSKLLQKMLDSYDRHDHFNSRDSERLVPAIATVFGGEQTARNYLRHDASYALSSEQSVTTSIGNLSRVERRRKRDHVTSPDFSHHSTVVSSHEGIGHSQASSCEEFYSYSHSSTTSEYVNNNSSNNQPETTFQHSQWGEDAILFSELFCCPQWDVLPQQLLLSPRELN